ncbi:MAG: hypothetical protein KDD37_08635 [Bdellovibrionales bacterium]|nr:hypothetical protein [Bdellovibrionales bacterium]
MEKCESYIDRLVQFFTSSNYHSEILSAKKEFFEQAGIIDEESHYFESRMAQFLDWYIFTRPMNQYHLPPVQLILNKDVMPMRDEEKQIYTSIATTIHSLFEFLKVRGSDVYVYDIFSKKKYVLKNSDLRVGFNPEEIFDARLVPFEGNYVFSKGFCFHPAEAKKFILKEIKKVRHLEKEQHEALMFKIMKMRYKLEQYKHIKLEYIYTNDPQLKL